ncbi:beta family protein [Pseudobacteroides cellulosolvens]|uniref:Protein beta n=1 Tax=Pseudobacteroides cellulosolvens ATCC 35603 = DSM 2933 TaxID=398512 RepID=A0A0L6JGF9_9FIRM|nr:beta family protein [Pseudobacteroides cellulosolvens]KNY24775.1 Protein beta [Pseudobacteroides cellulosolvens ATCC 35603 = DSM 2933]
MFNSNHYIPILKWKRGEQRALQELPNSIKDKFTPLIEIVPVPYDFVNDTPAKTIDQHLANIGEQIRDSWLPKKPLFIDLCWLDEDDRMEDGSHPIYFIMNEVRKKKCLAIPVIGYERDDDYKCEVKDAIKEDGLGVCIRLEDEDFLDIDSRLNSLMEYLEVIQSQVDILIDLKEISPDDEKKNILTIISIINSIPHVNEWRSITLAFTTFPETLSAVSADSTGVIPRSEWKIWKELINRKKSIKRIPAFSDYVIANPLYNEIDPRLMRMSANIRYTTNDDYLIFKGKAIKKNGWKQVCSISEKLINHPLYCGKDFSWGDSYIYICATEKCSTGNAETWRKVGTNHHITFIVNQLASFSEV